MLLYRKTYRNVIEGEFQEEEKLDLGDVILVIVSRLERVICGDLVILVITVYNADLSESDDLIEPLTD